MNAQDLELKSMSSAEQNYFIHFAMIYPVVQVSKALCKT